jgi:acyl-CoA synthetase (AMP-forming)/AMP-acid ligase II
VEIDFLTHDFASTGEVLRAVAHHYGDREAIVEDHRRVTFAEWDRAVDGVARLFHDEGVRKGDVVCLMLPSSIDYAVCYLAALRLGAIGSGLNVRFGPVETTSILTRLEPRLTVCDHGVVPPVPAGTVIERAALAAAEVNAPPPPTSVTLTDTACVVWTSGTTGQPKGAVFDHACLLAVARAINPLTRFGDRKLSPLPFPHVGFMTRVWDEIAHVITTVIAPVPFAASTMLAIIERERVTVAQGVPTQWRLMLNHPNFDRTDFSTVRLAGSGGAIVPPDIVREIRERLHVPVAVGYSSTECSMASGALLEHDVGLVNLVGQPYRGVEISIVDDDGRLVERGAVGNVRARSRAAMREYWHDPERTREVIDADGWITLGDLGRFNGDGDLELVGRKKDMYIRGGYNVYPAEVEAVLGEHPGVDRVAVAGAPNPVLGEIGVAFVVAVPGAAPTLIELRDWCLAHIADYKAPDRLELVDALPVNAMMKVDKAALLATLTS